MAESGFAKFLEAFRANLSGIEKASVVITLIVALAVPAASAIYVLGQQRNILENLNTRLNSLPTSEEFNLQLQLRDVRLQRIEYQLEQANANIERLRREEEQLREEMRQLHQ